MVESNSSPRIRRLCVSVDLEGYSRRTAEEQYEAQLGLDQVIASACTEARLDRSTWSRQPAGDGELAVLPPGIDEGETISALVRAMSVSLYRHNRRLSDRARLRVRMAMHAGMTQTTDLGFAGQAPVTAARLRDCPQARDEMGEHPEADLVVVISQQLYEDHVGHAYPDFDAASFRRIRVELASKNFSADAWLHRPARATPMESPLSGRSDHRPGAPGGSDHRSGGVYVTGGSVVARDIAGRDLRGDR